MKAKQDEKRMRGLAATLCALMMVPGRAAAVAAGGAEARGGIELTYQRLQLSSEARQRVDGLLLGREALLDYLPLARLERIALDAKGIELFFDFGKKDEKCITIPAAKMWALDRKGQVIAVKTKEQEIVIQDRVRIEFDAQGGLRLRKGDLQGKCGFFRKDLEAYTVRYPGRLVRDDDGRVILRTDDAGRPLLADGRPVARTSDEWLVIEAGERKFEVALSGS